MTHTRTHKTPDHERPKLRRLIPLLAGGLLLLAGPAAAQALAATGSASMAGSLTDSTFMATAQAQAAIPVPPMAPDVKVDMDAGLPAIPALPVVPAMPTASVHVYYTASAPLRAQATAGFAAEVQPGASVTAQADADIDATLDTALPTGDLSLDAAATAGLDIVAQLPIDGVDVDVEADADANGTLQLPPLATPPANAGGSAGTDVDVAGEWESSNVLASIGDFFVQVALHIKVAVEGVVASISGGADANANADIGAETDVSLPATPAGLDLGLAGVAQADVGAQLGAEGLAGRLQATMDAGLTGADLAAQASLDAQAAANLPVASAYADASADVGVHGTGLDLRSQAEIGLHA